MDLLQKPDSIILLIGKQPFVIMHALTPTVSKCECIQLQDVQDATPYHCNAREAIQKVAKVKKKHGAS